MNIQLKPEHEDFIQAQLATGKYTNAEEVVDKAFQLMEKLHSDYAEWIDETRQKVDIAIGELERGEGLDGETVVMEILERFQKAREASE
jgi:antitoxin ParD1/3/4